MSINNPADPSRLFVLLARETPVGVILRRGNHNWTQMIKWDTKRDVFTQGQWFKGKIHNHKCDLSPNGKYLIYFASKYSQKRQATKTVNWTAISKPPYFTALHIVFESDTWGGGGIFETSNKVWFYLTSASNWYCKLLPPSDTDPFPFNSQKANFTQSTVDRVRHELDGWIDIGVDERSKSSTWVHHIWRKKVKNYTLTYFENGRTMNPRYTNCYTLTNSKNEAIEISLANVLWADFDQQGRLVLAKEGKLFAGTLDNGELKLSELADFNANKPDPQPAPDWAQKW